MDEERQFTDSEREALNAVAKALQENAEREAQAIVGYTEQIRVIEDGIAKVNADTGNEMILSYFNALLAATKEKISDELNHSTSLIEEFVEITGIKIAEA